MMLLALFLDNLLAVAHAHRSLQLGRSMMLLALFLRYHFVAVGQRRFRLIIIEALFILADLLSSY